MRSAYSLDDFGFGGVEGEGAERADRKLSFEVSHVIEEQQLGLVQLVCLDEQLREVESDLLHEVQVLGEGRLEQQQVLLVGFLDEQQSSLFVGETGEGELLLTDVHGFHVEQHHAEGEDAVCEEQDWVNRSNAWAAVGRPRPARWRRLGSPSCGRSARETC